jgi:hypothetical protein
VTSGAPRWSTPASHCTPVVPPPTGAVSTAWGGLKTERVGMFLVLRSEVFTAVKSGCCVLGYHTCTPVCCYQPFGRTCCLHLFTPMKAVGSPKCWYHTRLAGVIEQKTTI